MSIWHSFAHVDDLDGDEVDVAFTLQHPEGPAVRICSLNIARDDEFTLPAGEARQLAAFLVAAAEQSESGVCYPLTPSMREVM